MPERSPIRLEQLEWLRESLGAPDHYALGHVRQAPLWKRPPEYSFANRFERPEDIAADIVHVRVDRFYPRPGESELRWFLVEHNILL